jgi:hypothetical protein
MHIKPFNFHHHISLEVSIPLKKAVICPQRAVLPIQSGTSSLQIKMAIWHPFLKLNLLCRGCRGPLQTIMSVWRAGGP